MCDKRAYAAGNIRINGNECDKETIDFIRANTENIPVRVHPKIISHRIGIPIDGESQILIDE